jgi:AcrR family transcriptional regulator
MAKSGSGNRSESRASRADTRQRLVDAALRALKEQGFVGASARSIANIGGFNQSLVFYYFGSVNELLLAALEQTSKQRFDRYREVADGASSLLELTVAAAQLYSEDLDSGHVTILAEMIGGSSSDPELGSQVALRLQPWLDLTREVMERFIGDTPFGQLLPGKDVAFGVVSLYLGMEMLSHLDGDRSRPASLFATAQNLTGLFETMTGDSEPSGSSNVRCD